VDRGLQPTSYWFTMALFFIGLVGGLWASIKVLRELRDENRRNDAIEISRKTK
jgi:hypothetical protein